MIPQLIRLYQKSVVMTGCLTTEEKTPKDRIFSSLQALDGEIEN